MSAWKTHPVGRARGAGLAGPPGPGLQPHGDRAGKQVPTPNTHIVGGLLEPGTPASHPCPGKHTPQPLSAHLWEWRCGATLTPERTQPETTMHTHSAPACARIMLPRSSPPKPYRPRPPALFQPGPSGLLATSFGAPFGASCRGQFSGRGSQLQAPLLESTWTSHIPDRKPGEKAPLSGGNSGQHLAAHPALAGSLDSTRGPWGGLPGGGSTSPWARPGHREQRAQDGGG